MKTLLSTCQRFWLLLALLAVGMTVQAQTPQYKLSVANEAQPSPNVYEFDVYISAVGSTPLELSNTQFGIAYDTSILNGGVVSTVANVGFARIAGTSDFPANYTSGNTTAGPNVSVVGGVNCRYLNLAASTIPPGGAGTGTIVPDLSTNCAAPGLRLSRFRLTSDRPFRTNSTAKHVFSTATGAGRTNTVISAFVGGLSTAITQAASNYSYNQSGACNNNVVLSPAATCAVIAEASSPTAVTCFGGNDGSVTITLSGTGTTSSGTYSIDGGGSVAYNSNPFTVSGLTAGAHNISVTTSTPCSASTGFTIGGPSGPCVITDNITACDSYTWPANGNTYTASGTYTFVGTSGSCPCTYQLNLTINSSTSSSESITACDSYTWPVNNQTYTTSGTYTSTSTNPQGCPHVSTLILTINSSTTSTENITACDSYTWAANGQTYTASGTYTANSTNAAGCPHVSTLVLTINASTSSTETITACDSYTWAANGQNYTASGTYTATSTNAAGCPHVSTLILTINSSSASSESATACDSYTWAVDGNTYTASGTYTFTGTNAAGCPHVYTLNLTINASTSSSETVTACDSYTWAVNGQTYTTSGTYTDNSTNAAGCPHVSTLILTINASTSSTETITACDSYTWAADGNTYTTSGTYTATSTNAAGCPHVSTLILTINSSSASSESATACDSYTWAVDGNTYTASGTYTFTGTNAAGCPHVYTLNLTINASTSSSETVTACDTYTWAVNGQTYTTSGTYTDNSTNAAGCPHVSTLVLTINASTSSTETITACDSYTWAANGQNYTTSGTYTATSTNAAGCPHVSTLILTINSSSASSESATACDSYTWAVDGNTYTASGTYTFTGTNAAGCPHVYTLNLTINASTSSSETVTACDSYTWAVDGNTYTASGTYTFTGTNAAGCPHVSTLVLTINASTSSTETITACDSYTWAADGNTYTTSGTYTATSTNAAGCPHVSTLILTINSSSASSESATACDSYTWAVDGNTYNASGTYTFTGTNAAGCPHVYTLNLTINASTSSSETVTACDTYTWAVNGQTYTTSGTYTDNSTNAAGCPHVSTLILTINASTSSTETITACDSYTWAADGNTYTTSGTYTATSTNAAGCPHVSTLILTINSSSASSESATACDSYTWAVDGNTYNASGTYTFTGTNAAGCPHVYTLNLTINASTSSSETVTACDSYTWAADGNTYTTSGTYTATSTNAAGCPHVSTLILTVNASTSSSETVTACGSYTWAANGQTYTSSGTYTANSTNAAGCPHVSTLILTINNVVVTATPSGSILCFGGMVNVDVTASGGTAPYIGTGSFMQAAGTVVYTVTDNAGCSGTASVTLTEPTKVEGTTSTTPANCGSFNGTATVTASGGTGAYSYLWSDGQTTATATGLGTGTYTVTITDANGCTGTASATITGVGGQPDPAGAISGPAGACRNTCVVYSVAPVSGATTYTWVLPAGATGSSTSNSITVCFDNTYAGGFICVTPSNTCGSGAQSCINVPVITVKPAQPGFIVGNPNPCGPGVFTYSIPPSANALSYTWSVTGSGVVILSGQGTNTVTVSFPAGFGQSVIGVYASNCVGVTSTRSTTLTGIPTFSSPLTGPGYVCAGTSGVAYSISAAIGAGSSYMWTTTGDITPVGPQGSTSMLMNFGPSFTTGTISVSTSSSCGSFTKTYTIFSTPAQPGSITGPSSNLCGQTGVTYSISAVTAATSYNWTVPAGVTITANTGLSITVNFTGAFTGTGSICVSAVGACGSSIARCYSVTALTSPPASPSGPTSVCKSQSGVVYTIPAVAGASSYLWSISGGAGIVPSGTSATVNFNSAVSSTAIITVNAVNGCGFSQPGKRTVAVNLGCRTSNDLTSVADFSAYPNPTSGMLTVNFQAEQSAKYLVKVTDLLGNVMISNVVDAKAGSNMQELNLSHVAKGMYLLSIESEGSNAQTLRVVVE